MIKSREEKIKARGYELLEEYAINNIASRLSPREAYACINEWMPQLENYYESSDAFHENGGDGYKMMQRCLKHFKDYKFVNINSEFRFQRDEYVSDSGRIKYIKSEKVNNKNPRNPLMGTKADIYYLLNEADQNDVAARRCRNYANSSKLHLTAIITYIIEKTVERMLQDDVKRIREYGKILYEAYLNPKNDEMDMNQLYELVGMSKKKFYTVRGEAISMLSRIVFGILPGEYGFSKLYIKDGEIISLYD